MRTIKLRTEEIERIKYALQFVYDSNLELVAKKSKVLGDSASKEILAEARKYFDILDLFDEE